MKKIVPLKQELDLKTNLAEITSIALEHNLSLEKNCVVGEVIISGSYKMNDTSINVEEFSFELPVNIDISDRYNIDSITIDIDDFYYEVIDNSILNVSVDIALDNLKEVEIVPVREEVEPIELKDYEEEIIPVEQPITELPENRINASEVKSLFDSFDETTETYATYKICIVKEGDTIESIMTKYSVSKEVIQQYNDINMLKIGDKLIIPHDSQS